MPDRGELLVEHDFLTSPASGVDVYGTAVDFIAYPVTGFAYWLGAYMVGGPYGIYCQTSYQADGSAGPYGARVPLPGPACFFDRAVFGIGGSECMIGTFTYRGDPTAPAPALWDPTGGVSFLFTNTVTAFLRYHVTAAIYPPYGGGLSVLCGVNQRDGLISVGEVWGNGVDPFTSAYTLGTVTATDPVGPHTVEFHHTATDITGSTPWDTATHTLSPFAVDLIAAVEAAAGTTGGAVTQGFLVGLTLDDDQFGFGPTVAISAADLHLCSLVDYIRLFPRDDDLGIGYSGQGRNPVRAARSGPTSVQRSYRNHNRVTRSGYQ